MRPPPCSFRPIDGLDTSGYSEAMASGILFFILAVVGYALGELILYWLMPRVFWWLSYVPGLLFVKLASLGTLRVESLSNEELIEPGRSKWPALSKEGGRWVLSAQGCWFVGFFLWTLVVVVVIIASSS